MKLKDKVVIITGSSSNIGKAIAFKFAEEGAKIVINSKTSVEAGITISRKINDMGVESIYIQADVSNPDQVQKLFKKVLDRFGTIDILINNAGASKATPFLESSKKDWLDAFDANFFGTVLCSKEAAGIMKKKGGGKIINTSSVRGLENTGRPGIIAYSAAKAAVINFTKTLAKELSPEITVNAVAPGFVFTSSYSQVSKEMQNNFIQSTLIKRWINVNEVANAFLFLASNDSVTGTVLIVDGGFTLK